jgi:hypothetical protein
MLGFPTPTNVVGVNANRRDLHKSGESPALHGNRVGIKSLTFLALLTAATADFVLSAGGAENLTEELLRSYRGAPEFNSGDYVQATRQGDTIISGLGIAPHASTYSSKT